jgi:NAD-dependent SIR2 family protein deacetylase
MLKVDATNMPPHLHRAIMTFERVITELGNVIDNADHLVDKMNAHLSALLKMHEELPSMTTMKSKKYNRIQDNFTRNVRILRGQLDLLESCRKVCWQALTQVTLFSEPLQWSDMTSATYFRIVPYLWYSSLRCGEGN